MTPAAPAATVIVPVHNAHAFVVEQLDALAAQLVGLDIECIVVDDASTDGTGDAIRAWLSRRAATSGFRLVSRARRGGPNASRNEGLRQARAEFVMFTDGDDVVANGWIDAFMAAGRADSLLGGRNADLAERADEGNRSQSTEPWSPLHWGGWPFAFGNCMAGPRRIFVEAGGFDENILLGGSETEYAIRAQRRLGIDVVGVVGALVWHRRPVTHAGWVRKHFMRERGYAYIRRRHRGAVRQPSIRIAIAQIGRGVSGLLTAGRRRGPSRSRALNLVARGVGGALGCVWWGAIYALRMPPPQLLEVSGDRSATPG